MQITFVAFGDLRRYTPQMAERMTLDLAPGTSVSQVLAQVGVPLQEVGLIVVNLKLAEEGRELAEGDTLEVFSPIGGGGGDNRGTHLPQRTQRAQSAQRR